MKFHKMFLVGMAMSLSYGVLADPDATGWAKSHAWNAVGVMAVNSITGQKEIMTAVPWVKVGTNGIEECSVDCYMLTNNLAIQDRLYRYNHNKESYDSWELQENGWVSVKKSSVLWTEKGPRIVSGSSSSPAITDMVSKPSGAFLLRREKSNIANPFYLAGQVPKKVVSAPEDLASENWMFVAPPTDSATDVNTQLTWSGLQTGFKGDKLEAWVDGQLIPLQYENNKWGYLNPKTFARQTTGLTIPAGQGFWIYKGQAHKISLTWGNNVVPTDSVMPGKFSDSSMN